jgi:hypothetical protein
MRPFFFIGGVEFNTEPPKRAQCASFRAGARPLMAENSVFSRVLYVASRPSTLTSTSEKVVFLALRAITSPSTMIIRIAGTSPNSMHPRPSLA